MCNILMCVILMASNINNIIIINIINNMCIININEILMDNIVYINNV